MAIEGLYLNLLCSPENSLNDGSGNGRNLAAAGAGGSIVSTPVYEGSYSVLPSVGGGWINTPAGLNAIMSGTDWSYETYFYLTSMAAAQTVITAYNAAIAIWGAYLNTNGSVSLIVNNSATTSATGLFVTNKYYYFGMSIGQAGCKIWLSDASNISQTPVISIAGATNPTITGAQIGRYAADGSRLMSAGYQDSIVISGETLVTVPTERVAVTPSASAVSDIQIDITWTDNTGNEGYVLYRNTSDDYSTSIEIGAANQGDQSFSDKSCTANTLYYYWVRHIKSGELGGWSASTSATSLAISAPTSLTASNPTTSTIDLAWTDAASPAAYYFIYQNSSDNSGTASLVDIATQGDQALTMCGLSGSTQYYYWVKTLSSSGALSAFTSSVNATTSAAAIPDAPTSLTATKINSNGIVLGWTDSTSANISHTLLYRNTSNTFATSTVAGSVEFGTLAYRDYGLTQGTAYYYWAVAVNDSDLHSTETSSATATTDTGVVVDVIADAMRNRIAAAGDSPYTTELRYAREPEKNGNGQQTGFGILKEDSGPNTDRGLLKSYTQTQNFTVLLSSAVVKGQSETAFNDKEDLLYGQIDKITADFLKTKLGITSVVTMIDEPSISAPELLKEGEQVIIRATYPITYRRTIV